MKPGYDVILILWGIAFELGGLFGGILIHRALRRGQERSDRAAAAVLAEGARRSFPPAVRTGKLVA